MKLVGMFFVEDDGEYYRSGEIIDSCHHDHFFMLQADDIKTIGAPMPQRLVSIDDLTQSNEDGSPMFTLFASRKAMDGWVALLRGEFRPEGGGKVVRITRQRE